MAVSIQLKKKVVEKLGLFPAFFTPALETPEILSSLLKQTISTYTNNPLPANFKEKLFVNLSRYFKIDYLTICHSCTLRALGMTAKEILAVNKSSTPKDEKELEVDWQLLEKHSPNRDRWYYNPELERSILRCSELIFIQPFATTACCLRLKQFLGATTYNYLIALLGYIKLCHQWVASHPEISYEQDRRAQLHLAPLLLEEVELREFFQKNLSSVIVNPIAINPQKANQGSQEFQLDEERLKMYFINAPCPIMIYGADGKVLHINKSWAEITGYSELEVSTLQEWQQKAGVQQQEIVRSRKVCWKTEFTFQQLVQSLLDLPENKKLTCGATSKVVNAIRSEVTIVTKNGEQRFWELYSAPLALYLEGIELTIAIAKDVTNFIRNEAKLVEIEARLKLVLEATKTGNWDWNFTSNQVDICHRARAILGLESFDNTYESFLQSIHEEERQSVDLAAIKAVKVGKELELEYRIVKQDGNIRWIRSKGKLNYDCSGKAVSLAGIVTDITEEKQIQQQQTSNFNQYQQHNVAQSLNELEHLLNSIPYYLFVVDIKTKCISICNLELAQSLGFVNSQQVQGKAIADCFPPENARHIVLQHEQVLASQEVLRTQEEVTLPDGVHYFDTVITPLKNPQGEIYALLHTSSDIPDLAAAQEALSERTLQLEAANRELESFSYSVSHDLQAPLRVINGFSQVLWENYNPSLDDRGRHYLQRIQANSERMSELIDALLQLSRITRSQMEYHTVNLSDIATEISRELQAGDPQRKVEFKIAPELTATGDPRLLRIVLDNLLHNAWKYSSKKPLAKIEFNVIAQEKKKLIYFVKDNGAGFDLNYASKLFSAFKRLHNEAEFPGTGIGLATVQRIIFRHGGKVWAEGECDRGATFYFSL